MEVRSSRRWTSKNSGETDKHAWGFHAQDPEVHPFTVAGFPCEEDRVIFLSSEISDGWVNGPCDVKNIVGNVAEQLVESVLGARRWTWDMPGFEIPKNVATETDGSAYELRPDVWWGKHTAVVEVKAGIARFYVTERQWNSYLWMKRSGSTKPRNPRVFYAFVGYSLSKKSKAYKRTHEVVRDALSRVEYIAVMDSKLVGALNEKSSLWGDSFTPLSPMLGAWHAHFNLRKARVRRWVENPEDKLRELGLSRWKAKDLSGECEKTFRALSSWGDFPAPKCKLFEPRRRRRQWGGALPGEQPSLLHNFWDENNPAF